MKIPRRIFQSWKSKELPPELQQNINRIKELNPGYEYQFFDDDDCRNYILKHFGVSYAFAFDNLIHGAFKCDFWRYCVLYQEGGIYIDIDMLPLIPFDEIIGENDELVTIQDRPDLAARPSCGIYQAFLSCVPKHSAMWNAVLFSFVNIMNQKDDLSNTCLDLTGPVVMGRALNVYWNRPSSIEKIPPGQYGPIKIYPYGIEKSQTFENKDMFIYKVDGYEEFSRKHTPYGDRMKYYKTPKYNSSSSEASNNFVWYYVFAFVVLLVPIALVNNSWLFKLLLVFGFFVILVILAGVQATHTYINTSDTVHIQVSNIKEGTTYINNNGSRIYLWPPELMRWYKNKEEIESYFGGRFFN